MFIVVAIQNNNGTSGYDKHDYPVLAAGVYPVCAKDHEDAERHAAQMLKTYPNFRVVIVSLEGATECRLATPPVETQPFYL